MTRSNVRRALLALCSLLCAGRALAQDATSTVYIFQDTDHTSVVSPRLRAGGSIGSSTRIDLAYAADIWTSASIDIRTSASKPVTEQRDELVASLRQEIGDTELEGSYRLSLEPDYVSHGATLGLDRSFADNNTALAISATLLFDQVGRAGDPSFSEPARHASLRASWTQVLDRRTFVQVLDEFGYSYGDLSSPYRFVGLGAADGTCREPSRDCLREANPDERLRNALAVIGRHALTNALSAGLSYRFYADDWSMMSHTVEAELSLMPAAATRLALRYRFYRQSAASHYQARFLSRADAGSFYSRDKELSPLISQRVALDFEHSFELSGVESLRVIASAGPSLYLYSDFPPLHRIEALELTLGLNLML